MSDLTPSGRFVVLRHEPGSASRSSLHWDLMLEAGDTLRTWALDAEPMGVEPIVAEQLAAHRLAYLDFEGPISGDRGYVAQWDRGTYRLLSDSADCVLVEFAGTRLRGRAALARDAKASAHWVLRLSSGSDATSG